MSTDLTRRDWTDMAPAQFELILRQADVLVQSGVLPKHLTKPEAVVAIALTARELGVPPMTGLRTIHMVDGKPTAAAELLAALVYRDHGDAALEVTESTAEQCVIRYQRRGWAEGHTYTYTLADVPPHLKSKPTWQQYPAAMLRSRAISAVCKTAFQDSTLGMYTPEELGAEVEAAEDGTVTVVALPAAPSAPDVVAALPEPAPIVVAEPDVRDYDAAEPLSDEEFIAACKRDFRLTTPVRQLTDLLGCHPKEYAQARRAVHVDYGWGHLLLDLKWHQLHGWPIPPLPALAEAF